VNLEPITEDIINRRTGTPNKIGISKQSVNEPAVKFYRFEAAIMINYLLSSFDNHFCGQGAKFYSNSQKKCEFLPCRALLIW
jgi:hypothetical protein